LTSNKPAIVRGPTAPVQKPRSAAILPPNRSGGILPPDRSGGILPPN
jgi:hypothetical protein